MSLPLDNSPSMLLTMLACLGACAVIAATPVSTFSAAAEPSVMRSASRRFVVIGADRPAQRELLHRAESMAGRVERLTGVTLWLDNDAPIRLVLTDEEVAGGVETGLSTVLGRPAPRLMLSTATPPVPTTLDDALCRVLLSACFAGRGIADPATIPGWLVAGCTENLTPARRARNSGEAYARWRDGALPSPAVFLRDPNAGFDRAMSGMLIGWLVDLPDSRTRFAGLFESLAEEGRATPEALAAVTTESGDLGDLDAGWDRWMLRQKRMVYQPGLATRYDVDALQAELLLYPGSFGIPRQLSDGPLRLRDLIAYRRESWMSVLTFSKRQSLRLLALGRGGAMADVVERYVAFLDALGGKAGDEHVVVALDEADAALTRWSQDLGE